MAISQNGYPVLFDIDNTKSWKIPGAQREIRLAQAAPGLVLAHFALWFHEIIEPLNGGIFDEWGWAVRDIRGSDEWSNHASGTAMDLNATKHPLGTTARSSFSLSEIAAINNRLAFMDNAVRWGGNYSGRQDPMHFEVNASTSRVARLADELRKTARGQRIIEANR
jgi:hypothetical protein